MPVTCTNIGGKWRITAAGQIEKTPGGVARDGGGHSDREACMAQARAINASLSKREGGINRDGVYEPDGGA